MTAMPELKLVAYSEVVTKETPFLWKPYLPQGKLVICQGDPGQGKTTLMLAVAAAISSGDALPGGEKLLPMAVIYQSAEDGYADTIKPRLEQLGADNSRIHYIDDDEEPLSLSDPRIEEAIIATGAGLLVLDPIQAYLRGTDLNSAQGMRPLLNQLGGVAERTGCCLVLIGHLNKKGKTQYRGLGSIDIRAAARSVITVAKLDDAIDLRVMLHSKSNLTAPGAALSFSFGGDNSFSWQGEQIISEAELLAGARCKSSQESQLQRAVNHLEALLRPGAMAVSEIKQRSNEAAMSWRTIVRAKEELGIRSEKVGDQWFWSFDTEAEIPPETASGEECQGCQADTLALLAPLITDKPPATFNPFLSEPVPGDSTEEECQGCQADTLALLEPLNTNQAPATFNPFLSEPNPPPVGKEVDS